MGAGYEPPPAPRLRALPVLCCLLAVALLFGVVISVALWIGDPPKYSVAIPSASGLDYRGGQQGQPAPLLDPLFNLTVRIASQSGRSQACLNPTTSVHVRYMGVQLAAERVPPGLCAAPWRSKERSVVARAQGVTMSPFLLDTLAHDVGNGDAQFEVLLMSPQGNHWEVHTCMAKIGKPAAKCSCTDVAAADMPARPQQRSD